MGQRGVSPRNVRDRSVPASSFPISSFHYHALWKEQLLTEADYKTIVKEMNRKLARDTHCDFIPDKFILDASSDGNHLALFFVTAVETPFFYFKKSERVLVFDWCFKSYGSNGDGNDWGEEQELDIRGLMNHFVDHYYRHNAPPRTRNPYSRTWNPYSHPYCS